MSVRGTVFWTGTDLKLHSRVAGPIPIPPQPAQYPTAVLRVTSITGLTIAVSGSGSRVSAVVTPTPTITSYSIDWGDGSTSQSGTISQATHTYATAGTYTLGLTVTDSNGLIATTRSPVTVAAPVNRSPVPSFTAGPSFPSGTQYSGYAFDFDASASTDPDGTVASYAWNFGDGGAASGVSTSHRFSSAGTFNVSLTVTDDKGGSATIAKQITVSIAPLGPTAGITYTASNLTVTFDGSSSKAGSAPITTYTWDFGDGTTGSGIKPAHTYGVAGSYTVKLTVKDSNGLTDLTTGTGTVTSATSGGVQPSGAGIAQIQTLAGSTLGNKIRSTSQLVSFPAGIFDMVDFAEQVGTTAPTINGVGADITGPGILGSGSGVTTFQLRANTSTKSTPTSLTNQMSVLQTRNQAGLRLEGFTVQATAQKNLYNGLTLRSANAPKLSDIVVRGFAGNSQSPPGETFGVNLANISGGATITSCEGDGAGVAASLFATNTFGGSLVVNGLYVHDTYSSSHKAAQGACKGIAMWQHTGGGEIRGLKSRRNWATFGFERCSGVFRIYNPDLDGSDKLFGHLGQDSYGAPCKIEIYVDSAAQIPTGGYKFWIPAKYDNVAGHTTKDANKQTLNDVTVFVGGVARSGYTSSVGYPA